MVKTKNKGQQQINVNSQQEQNQAQSKIITNAQLNDENKQQVEEEKSGFSFMKSFFGGIIQHLPPNSIIREQEVYNPQVTQQLSKESTFISKSATKPSTDIHIQNAQINQKYQGQQMLQWEISEQNKVILGGWLEISYRQGDITEEKVDAIANSTNELLLHDAGVSKAILLKGGIKIQEESEQWILKNKEAQTGTARVVTTPGNMRNCKYIIHAVGPVWTDGLREDEQLLYDCIRDVFQTAIKQNCKSVALPAISTGYYGFPKNLCAAHFFRAAEDFCFENNQNDCCLKQIRFTVFENETLEAFQNEFTWRYKGRVFCFPNTGTFNEGLQPIKFKKLRGQFKRRFNDGLQIQQMSSNKEESNDEESDYEDNEQIIQESIDQIEQQKVMIQSPVKGNYLIYKEVHTQTITYDKLVSEIRRESEVDNKNKQVRQIQLNMG